ncbi:hypothetical protein HOY80DRAFT_950212 [Tuber brumale]|nr:hypothetical protein HOY80DRAFT_950212 [Tuber brumale]
MLLNHVDTKPDIPDDDGRTPLSWVVWNGHQEIVKVLLERRDFNPDARDLSGETPLSWAPQNHRYAIAKHLSKRKRYDQSPSGEDPPEILSPEPSEIPDSPSKRTCRYWLAPALPHGGGWLALKHPSFSFNFVASLFI